MVRAVAFLRVATWRLTGGRVATGSAMASLRESSVESFASACSAVTGDDGGETVHDKEPVKVSCDNSMPPSWHRGGGDGAGRFGIYQGNWGGRRRVAQLPEIAN